jgi:hypothetical protein|uniref:ATP synthase F0 subunit 8 n=1 Tax=Baffinella frigidus TaxID=2571260 RepID=A0A6C0X6A2_9CRYP|nr:ATP synthase F0 subunit 8 [Cryptophyta sp. CCMP2293]
MPQLDLMHFFSQFFWFSVGFSFLHIFTLHNIMPTIFMNLKFRQKKIQLLASSINKNKGGALNLFKSYDSVIVRLFRFWKTFFLQTLSSGFGWVSVCTKIFNNYGFFLINKDFMSVIASSYESKV